MNACEKSIMITAFVSKALAYIMYSDMERMRVGCFELIGCIITMLSNDVHNSKTNPQGMPIGSFTVPKVDANFEANSEEYEDIVPMDEKYAALDE